MVNESTRTLARCGRNLQYPGKTQKSPGELGNSTMTAPEIRITPGSLDLGGNSTNHCITLVSSIDIRHGNCLNIPIISVSQLLCNNFKTVIDSERFLIVRIKVFMQILSFLLFEFVV